MAPKPPDLGVDPGTLSRVGVLRDSARPAGESEGVAAVKPQPILSVAPMASNIAVAVNTPIREDFVRHYMMGDLRHALEDMRQARDDALEERNRWRGQAERLALPAPEDRSQAATPPPRRWWSWRRAG